jgi:hypothetical protein
MSDLLKYIHKKVFNTRIMRKSFSDLYVGNSSYPKDMPMPIDYLTVRLIVMSHDTYYEVMRLDYSGTVVDRAKDKTEPDRVLGARVAYDDSLRFGEVLVTGELI